MLSWDEVLVKKRKNLLRENKREKSAVVEEGNIKNDSLIYIYLYSGYFNNNSNDKNDVFIKK
jgi:hypothetical protein